MRRLFIVGAKIAGLACIFWIITTATQFISYIGVLFGNASVNSSDYVTMVFYVIGIAAFLILSLCFTIILLFRTEWLADKLKLEKDGDLPNWPELNTLLNLGIILLGLYILATAIPSLGRSVIIFISQISWIRSAHVSSFRVFFQHLVIVIADIFKVAIGLIFILMPGRLISFTQRWQKKYDKVPAQAQG